MEDDVEYPARLINSIAAFNRKLLFNLALSLCKIFPPHNVTGELSEINNLFPSETETDPPIA